MTTIGGVGDVRAGEASGGFDAVHQRHSDVEQADVGAQLERQADCLAPVGGRADHFDVGLGVEQHRQPGAHDGLVVGDEDPDAHRGVPVRGRTASTRQPRSAAGPAWKVPPSSVPACPAIACWGAAASGGAVVVDGQPYLVGVACDGDGDLGRVAGVPSSGDGLLGFDGRSRPRPPGWVVELAE